MDPGAGLEDTEKIKFLTLPGLELRPLGHPAHSQSLYRLRYPSSHITYITLLNNIMKPVCYLSQTISGKSTLIIFLLSVSWNSNFHFTAAFSNTILYSRYVTKNAASPYSFQMGHLTTLLVSRLHRR
jgi:hypothetical protein